MRIKATDAPEGARTSSTQLTAVSLPTSSAGPRRVPLSLSGASRVLAAALSRVLPELGGLRVRDVLTAADRTLLARASELADATGTDPEQIRRLVMDLAAFRARALSVPSSEPSARAASFWPFGAATTDADASPQAERAAPTGAGTVDARLTLPTLSTRDETLARTILASLPQRDTSLPSEFVQTLLDPDAQAGRTVDLGFLRQLVIAMAPTQAGVSRDAPIAFSRREARGLLAKALAALALPRATLSPVQAHGVAHGSTLLRERLPEVMRRASVAWAALPRAVGTEGPPASLLAAMARTLPALHGDRDASARDALNALFASGLPRAGRAAPARPASLPLSRDDRSLLKLLYATAAARGEDLRAVDDVAGALVTLRLSERLEGGRGHAGVAHASRSGPRDATPGAAPARSAAQAPLPAKLAGSSSPYEAGAAARSRLAENIVLRAEAASGYRMPTLAPPTASQRGEEPASSPCNRSFGSSSQLAARLASTYGQPLGHETGARAPGASTVQAEATARLLAEAPHAEASAHGAGLTSLDLAQALGLGALFGEVYRASLRTRRWRRLLRHRRARHSIGRARPAPAVEADDDMLFEPRARQRRSRR